MGGGSYTPKLDRFPCAMTLSRRRILCCEDAFHPDREELSSTFDPNSSVLRTQTLHQSARTSGLAGSRQSDSRLASLRARIDTETDSKSPLPWSRQSSSVKDWLPYGITKICKVNVYVIAAQPDDDNIWTSRGSFPSAHPVAIHYLDCMARENTIESLTLRLKETHQRITDNLGKVERRE